MKIYAIVYSDGTNEQVDTWDVCKAKTQGVSGVSFKSFTEQRLADAWIREQCSLHEISVEQVQEDASKPCFYTDGAFKKGGLGFAGWAFVMMRKTEVIHMDSGRTPDLAMSRNIDGEVYAAYMALSYMLHNLSSGTYYLVHDLLHISQWAKGLWKVKPKQQYVSEMCEIYSKLINAGFNIVFIHVKGHTGKVLGNTRVDQLATKYV